MESDVMRKIQIALSTVGARVFRNNVGLGWVGKIQRFTQAGRIIIDVQPGDILIRQARPLHAGLIEGASDLIGWSHDGRFLACEVKDLRGRPTKTQENFINAVKASGGIAFVARSNDEALKQYEDAKNVNR